MFNVQMFADKSVHLGKAMEQAMGFHEDLAALNEFLDSAEQVKSDRSEASRHRIPLSNSFLVRNSHL